MENSPKSRSEWFALVKEFEQSNTTQINFCKQKVLILGRFTYYAQIYRKDIKSASKYETPSFSQVVINQPHSSSSHHEIKIELPNGFRCQIPLNISSEALKKLIGALLSC
jgi:hypothetical protein